MKIHTAIFLLLGSVSLIFSCGKSDNSTSVTPTTPTSSTTVATTTPTSKTTLIGTLRSPYKTITSVNLTDTNTYNFEDWRISNQLVGKTTDPYYQFTTTIAKWLIATANNNQFTVLLNDKTGNYHAYYPQLKDGWWVTVTSTQATGLYIDFINPADVYFLYPGGVDKDALDPTRSDLKAVLAHDYNNSCRVIVGKK